MLTLPIKEKERSEHDEKDAPEIDLRISRGIKGKSANVRPEGRRRVSYFQVNFATQSLQLLKNNQAKPSKESFLSRFLVLKLAYISFLTPPTTSFVI